MPVRLLRGLVLLTLAATAGCHRQRGPAATLSPAERRELLLHPDAAFWQTHAPDTVRIRIETTKGPFVLELQRALAPRGVDRFYGLVRAGFFDDSRFFRVVPNFIVQFGIPGDPTITPHWSGRAFPDDSVRATNVRGTIGFAMTGPNTRTTQLYINVIDNTRLDAQGFSPLGRVISGMSVVDSIYSGYGETSGGGVRAGKQQHLLAEGNAYLDREFPKLDKLIRAVVVP
jgi:cyclophilin family peptidyl-prolyl cis-trans isomerase